MRGRRGDEPASYVHSSELRAPIGGPRRERLRRGQGQAGVARVTDQARSAINRLENGHYPNA